MDENVLNKIMQSEKQVQRTASAAFLSKQRERATVRKASFGVSALSMQSQAELDRKPLTASEVENMFAGAPYFSVEEVDGRYKAEVSFRGEQAKLMKKFASDYEDFSHPSFAASTLCRRFSERWQRAPRSPGSAKSVKPASDVVEVPSMLSANGIDPGAVGFEHYLQLPLGDSTVPSDESALLEKRKQLRLDPGWLGLRELNMEVLINRLTEIGELHAGIKQGQMASADSWNKDKLEEMGEDLFEKLLTADLSTTDSGTASVPPTSPS